MAIFSNTDLKVEAILQQWGTKRETQYHGLVSDGKWEGDSFIVTLGTQQFKYKTGIEPRYYTKLAFGDKPPKFAKKADKSLTEMQAIIGRSGFAVQGEYFTFVPVPASASVIQCLLLDSSAANSSFDDWCANYGYDTDSRKALETYFEGQQTATKLRKVFTNSQLETLQAMLEEY